jgi:hypothetical protein
MFLQCDLCGEFHDADLACSQKLQEGDVFFLELGMRVYADVPRHFLYGNMMRGDWSIHNGEVTIIPPLDYLVGEYVVYKTMMDGGGTGHGPGDVYPDGYHVFAERINTGEKIDFYQSGSFTCVLPRVKIIRSLTKRIIWEEKKNL